MITMKEYLAAVPIAQEENPEWRYGQTLFNVLYRMEPALADEIRGSEIDPFYVGQIAASFFEWLGTKIPVE